MLMLDSSNCMLDCSDDTQPCRAFCVLESIFIAFTAFVTVMSTKSACGEVKDAAARVPRQKLPGPGSGLSISGTRQRLTASLRLTLAAETRAGGQCKRDILSLPPGSQREINQHSKDRGANP